MKRLLARAVLRIHDYYCDACAWLRRFFLFCLHSYYESCTENVSSCRVIYACDRNRIDLTPIIQGYYKHDRILSCASLDRWIISCGHICSQLQIVFVHDQVLKKSVIDLANDLEILTNMDATDTSLSTLPCIRLEKHPEHHSDSSS